MPTLRTATVTVAIWVLPWGSDYTATFKAGLANHLVHSASLIRVSSLLHHAELHVLTLADLP